jgi:sugar (pentulose or hexulose) kinase
MFAGLDLGTTNVKALLCDERGKVRGRGAAPVRLLHVEGGGVEQEIEEIRRAAVEAAVAALRDGDGESAEALGLSSQGGALQLVDGAGRPLERVISWMDRRGRPYAERMTARLGREWFADRIGHGGAGLAVGQVLRLRRERPDLLERAGRIGFVGDVLVEGLCGRAAHDATSLSLALLYNPSLRTADPHLLRELALTEAELPDLVEAREPAGQLTPEAARQVGLPPGLPVSPAVHDQYAAAIGCGAVNAGDVMLGAGTAWVLLAVSERLRRPVIPEAFVCTHLVTGLYGQMLSLVNGGSCFDWACELLGLGAGGPRELDALLATAPPGAEGVRCWPFMAAPGGAGLAPGTTGRLSGLGLSHGPAHLLRAVVEGLAFELARYLRVLTDAGVPVGRLVMCGGATAGDVTPQIVADVTGLAVTCCSERDTSAFGAAVLARALVEPSQDLAELSRRMSPPARPFDPGPDRGVYADLFEEHVQTLPLAEGGG